MPTKFVRQTGGGSGDTFASPYTLAEAITYLNALTVAADVRILICEDLTLASTPAALTKSGNTTGLIIWEGRSDADEGVTPLLRIINANSVATRVFSYNEAPGLTFQYHHWRDLDVRSLELAAGRGAWNCDFPTSRRLSWYNCRGRTSAWGFKFSINDTMEECALVGCNATGNTNDGIRLPDPV